MNSRLPAILTATVCLATSAVVEGQTVYSDNFDTGASDAANWNINLGPGNNAATFGFDYSALGIPSAPHSIGGSTIGVKLEANYATGTGVNASGTGVSISPSGQTFTGDYTVTFDFWENFVGPAGGTGSGTTQLTGGGIGATGTTAQHAGVATTSLWFAQTGDGGNAPASKDYRIYSSAASGPGTGYAVASGVYAAGTGSSAADNATPYYAALGGNTEPAGETALSAQQNGTTAAGAPGFRWRTATINKTGNTVTYTIDSTLIATVDASTVTFGGSNLELIQSDVNATASTDPTVRTFEFGLFDNVVVTVPEPTTLALGLLGAGLLIARRRAKN